MGLTTVQDGGALPENIAMFEEAARRKLLTLDVVAYRIWMPVGSAFPENLNFGQYRDRFRLGGIKMVLDGSPQGKTAFLTKPYVVPPPGQSKDYRGYPSMPRPLVEKAVREVIAKKVTLLAHANGDAAADILIDAVAAARREAGNNEAKVVAIHAQTVRADQLDRMAALAITPSFFVGHTFFWGDWHRDETVGEPRAENISPTRWAADRAIPFTMHNDAPVVPPDMLRTLWSAATRRTRSNDILGPMQRLSIHEALEALTINGARQYSEQDRKGSISVGKLADLVILNRNPLEVDPERILGQLRIEETISHGKTIYRRRAQ
jgi:predicted amidohydrolase YtcJ